VIGTSCHRSSQRLLTRLLASRAWFLLIASLASLTTSRKGVVMGHVFPDFGPAVPAAVVTASALTKYLMLTIGLTCHPTAVAESVATVDVAAFLKGAHLYNAADARQTHRAASPAPRRQTGAPMRDAEALAAAAALVAVMARVMRVNLSVAEVSRRQLHSANQQGLLMAAAAKKICVHRAVMGAAIFVFAPPIALRLLLALCHQTVDEPPVGKRQARPQTYHPLHHPPPLHLQPRLGRRREEAPLRTDHSLRPSENHKRRSDRRQRPAQPKQRLTLDHVDTAAWSRQQQRNEEKHFQSASANNDPKIDISQLSVFVCNGRSQPLIRCFLSYATAARNRSSAASFSSLVALD
jgi:hypothetical protein